MLVLKRREGQKIIIGNDITIVVVRTTDVDGSSEVTLGIDAPNHVTVDRQELREKRINRINGVISNGKSKND